jgi:hypothetical protein
MRALGDGTERCSAAGRFGTALQAFVFMCGWLGAGFVDARPLVPAEERYLPYRIELPACGDSGVADYIQTHFREREEEFWKSGLEIIGFEQTDEIGFRTTGLDYIPRRYCVARAYMNDSKIRSVSFSIGEDLGIIGFGWGVEWCVAGLDRNNADAPNCKMARP